jgi:hypothetical protein
MLIVRHRVRAKALEHCAHFVRATHIEHHQLRGRGHVLAPAGRQIVDHQHFVSARECLLCNVTADEAGAAGDQNAHGSSLAPEFERRVATI